jgi:hypothetical protein
LALYNYYNSLNLNIELETIQNIITLPNHLNLSNREIVNISSNTNQLEDLINNNNDNNDNNDNDLDSSDSDSESESNFIVSSYQTDTNSNILTFNHNYLYNILHGISFQNISTTPTRFFVYGDENVYEYNNTLEFEDVRITLDESERDKLKKIIIEIPEQCIICLEQMQMNSEAIKLPCSHIYHDTCIEQHLFSYSNKCPCCRQDIGLAKFNT